MANITIYKIEKYNKDYYRIFSGVYNDFCYKAASDYNFELEPLVYDKFTESIEKGLLNCLILFEDDIPTGFLVYTTIISEALELNIIHCIGNENLNNKRKLLLNEFLKTNKDITKERVVTYPMLGKQNSFAEEIQTFGFKIVNTSVMNFNLSDINALNRIRALSSQKPPKEYFVTNWKTLYFKDCASLINVSFKNSSDALFDSRFTNVKGCKDIIEKITSNIYGTFLPGITKVLIYKKHIIGVCFANLTNEKLANIPIVAIAPEHRHQGCAKFLLIHMLNDLINTSISKGWSLKEINVSCDSDSIASTKLYKSAGFLEQYSYSQAYLPKQSEFMF